MLIYLSNAYIILFVVLSIAFCLLHKAEVQEYLTPQVFFYLGLLVWIVGGVSVCWCWYFDGQLSVSHIVVAIAMAIAVVALIIVAAISLAVAKARKKLCRVQVGDRVIHQGRVWQVERILKRGFVNLTTTDGFHAAAVDSMALEKLNQ